MHDTIHEQKTRPLFQLVPDILHFIGYRDARKYGLRGVWQSDLNNVEPAVWKYPIPADIQAELCTVENSKGKITMNDLELTGMVLTFILLEYLIPRL